MRNFQLLVTVGENGPRTERSEGGEGLDWFLFYLGFTCTFHSFPLLLGKQVSHFRADCLNFSSSIFISFSLLFVFSPFTQREFRLSHDVKTNAGKLQCSLLQSTFSWAALGPTYFKAADTSFPLSHRKVCHSFSSTEYRLSPGTQWQPTHNLSSVS